MSLIKCCECGKEVSDKSDKCIHCGYPISKIKIKNGFIPYVPLLVSGVVFFILIMVYVVMDTETDSSTFYTVFSTILLLLSAGSIGLSFYVIPRERKILFPLSIIGSIFVFMSIMGTAFKAFN